MGFDSWWELRFTVVFKEMLFKLFGNSNWLWTEFVDVEDKEEEGDDEFEDVDGEVKLAGFLQKLGKFKLETWLLLKFENWEQLFVVKLYAIGLFCEMFKLLFDAIKYWVATAVNAAASFKNWNCTSGDDSGVG